MSLGDGHPPILGDDADTPACFATEPASFQTVNEVDCWYGDTGVSRCRQGLWLRDGFLEIETSDITQSFPYTCTGNELSVPRGDSIDLGRWDPSTQHLTFWSRVYERI